jgi:thioredoxin 1
LTQFQANKPVDWQIMFGAFLIWGHSVKIPPDTLYIGDKPMSDAIVHVTDANFESEVLQADLPVLVDYWAEWCGPCKMIAPVLDSLADEYAGKLKICKMDVDANKDIPAKFGIRGIPTLMVFKGGNAEATKVGALSKKQLEDFLDGIL